MFTARAKLVAYTIVAVCLLVALALLVRSFSSSTPNTASSATSTVTGDLPQSAPRCADTVGSLESRLQSPPLSVAREAGWVVAFLLSVLLIFLAWRWRTAFETKEWLLMPSDQARQLQGALQHLDNASATHLERVSNRVATTAEDVRDATRAIHETRAEFSILRDELDNKAKEIAALRLGQEFHMRRPVLMRVIRALAIIDDDFSHQRDIRQTLEGVQVELRECLEDNAVSIYTPTPGTRLADAKGIDAHGAKREPTADEALRGTIASTDSPAYVARGPQGAEEVLLPAKVRVFV